MVIAFLCVLLGVPILLFIFSMCRSIGEGLSRKNKVKSAMQKQTAPIQSEQIGDRSNENLFKTPSISLSELERRIVRLFRAHGYQVERLLQTYGTDVHLSVYKEDERSIVVGTRRSQPIDQVLADRFLTGFEQAKAQLGYLIALSGFEQEVKEWAKGKRLVLIDHEMFEKMLEELEERQEGA